MAFLGKLTATLGCAAMAFTVATFATANQTNASVEATHFVSSGRVVNVVADMSADAQAEARAAIWALTQQVEAPTCAVTGSADASCFDTFQAGDN